MCHHEMLATQDSYDEYDYDNDDDNEEAKE